MPSHATGAVPDYPRAAMDLPPDVPARLCAQRLLEHTTAFMVSQGWPVELPVLRTADRPLVVYGAGAFAVTFPWNGAHFVVLSPDVETAWCRNLRFERGQGSQFYPGKLEVAFHEVLHQVLPSHDEIIPAARRLGRLYTQQIFLTRP